MEKRRKRDLVARGGQVPRHQTGPKHYLDGSTHSKQYIAILRRFRINHKMGKNKLLLQNYKSLIYLYMERYLYLAYFINYIISFNLLTWLTLMRTPHREFSSHWSQKARTVKILIGVLSCRAFTAYKIVFFKPINHSQNGFT